MTKGKESEKIQETKSAALSTGSQTRDPEELHMGKKFEGQIVGYRLCGKPK